MDNVKIRDGRKYKNGVYDPATDTTRTDVKGRIRKRIQSEVIPGEEYDIFDLCADLAKRLNMIERGMMVLLYTMQEAGTLPEEISEPYSAIITTYMEKLSTGEYEARTDLEADNYANFIKLMQRDNQITQILKEEGYA